MSIGSWLVKEIKEGLERALRNIILSFGNQYEKGNEIQPNISRTRNWDKQAKIIKFNIKCI